MPGDHSNVGGSWEEQQLADIALAWMMSRFEVLGVKFDLGYLYGEYKKFRAFVEDKGPKLKGRNGSDDGPAYPEKLSPRNWGEGKREIWLSKAMFSHLLSKVESESSIPVYFMAAMYHAHLQCTTRLYRIPRRGYRPNMRGWAKAPSF